MKADDELTILVTRIELALITDGLELLEDAEHLRPWRQDLARALLDKLERR